MRAMHQYSTLHIIPTRSRQHNPGLATAADGQGLGLHLRERPGWGGGEWFNVACPLDCDRSARLLSISRKNTHTHSDVRWCGALPFGQISRLNHTTIGPSHSHLALPHTACLFHTQAPPVVSASLFPTTLAKTLFSLCAHPPLPLPQTQGFALPIPSIFFSHGVPDHSVNIATSEHHQEPGRLPCSSTPGC